MIPIDLNMARILTKDITSSIILKHPEGEKKKKKKQDYQIYKFIILITF